jgi:hypothetical protein
METKSFVGCLNPTGSPLYIRVDHRRKRVPHNHNLDVSVVLLLCQNEQKTMALSDPAPRKSE